MKRTAYSLVVAAVLMAGLSANAMGANQGKGQDNRAANQSACGAVHGAFADENGNFGFLGEAGGTPGYHDGATGQDAGATGYNNSHTSCQDS